MVAEQLEFNLGLDVDSEVQRLRSLEEHVGRLRRSLFGRIGDVGKFCLEIKLDQDLLVERLYLIERRLQEAGL